MQLSWVVRLQPGRWRAHAGGPSPSHDHRSSVGNKPSSVGTARWRPRFLPMAHQTKSSPHLKSSWEWAAATRRARTDGHKLLFFPSAPPAVALMLWSCGSSLSPDGGISRAFCIPHPVPALCWDMGWERFRVINPTRVPSVPGKRRWPGCSSGLYAARARAFERLRLGCEQQVSGRGSLPSPSWR